MLLFVNAMNTPPVTGLRWMSSGRSILVASTRSAASRVNTSTCSRVLPGTRLLPPVTSGSHCPVPPKRPSAGSSPEPSISAAGLSPVKRATYRSPSSSRVRLWLRADLAVPRAVFLAGDELVDIVVALVIAHVGDHAAVLGDRDGRALVLEPAQRCVLARGGCRVGRVHLDDPPEPVTLGGFGGQVETRVDVLPSAFGALARLKP